MNNKIYPVLISVISFAIGVVICIIFIELEKYQLFADISNGLYGSKSQYFFLEDKAKIEQIMESLEDEVLFCEINSDYKAIYFKSEYNLPMIEGRFFENRDFDDSTNNYIVIGTSHIHNIYIKNNKKMFNFGGQEFEVIGVVGMNIPSPLDNMILFSYNNVSELLPNNSLHILSSSKDNLNLVDVNGLTVVDYSEKSANRMLANKVGVYSIMLSCAFLYFYVLYILFVIQLTSYKKLIRLHRILGFPVWRSTFLILINHLKFLIIPFLLGNIVAILSTDRYFLNFSLLTKLLIGCILIILTGWTDIWVCTIHMQKRMDLDYDF